MIEKILRMPTRRKSFWERFRSGTREVFLPERVSKRTIVDSLTFNGIVGVIIFVNVILMGIEVDSRCAPDVCTSWEEVLWKLQENFFAIIYLCEMSIRLYYKRLYYFQSMTNILDFFLVLLTVFDVWILGYLLGQGGSLKAVTVLRTLRYVRLIRVARVMNKYHSLYMIFNGLLNLSRFAVPIIVVGTVMVYIGAILARVIIIPGDQVHALYVDNPWSGDVYWGSIPKSMFTLFQLMTGDWWSAHVARPIVSENPAKVIYFVLMVFVLKIGLPSILVGTACEELIFMGKMSHKQNDDRRTKRMNDAANVVTEAFTCMADHGLLHFSDMKRKLKNVQIRRALAVLDVHVHDVEAVFAILDVDTSGRVDCARFIKGVVDVKNVGAGRDVTTLTVSASQLVDRIRKLENLAQSQDTLLEHIAQDIEKVGMRCGIVRKKSDSLAAVIAPELPGTMTSLT